MNQYGQQNPCKVYNCVSSTDNPITFGNIYFLIFHQKCVALTTRINLYIHMLIKYIYY